VSAVLTAQEPSAKYLVNVQPPLVRHFDLIAQAPGGVARLRELILTLAVQGKLVPQDASDEPASELLKKIRAEKDRLIADGKIKRDKPLAEIADEEKPFELPNNWGWVRALDICVLITDGDHQPPPKADAGVPFLVIGDVRTGVVVLQGASRFVPESYFEELDWGKKPCLGDVLYTTVGSFGIPVPVVQQQSFCFQRHIALFRPATLALQSFLATALRTKLAFQQAEMGATGIAQKTVPLSALRNLVLPLPPLAEQSRIVNHVEELMQLCDALEANGQRQAQQHAQLAGTLLGTLTQSETPEALNEAWQRIATHFDVLLDRPSSVDAFEQTILQLAVRGLLVPQDPTDEPASSLLQKIRTEKDHLIAQGKIKRDKPLPPITDEEKPFELPQGWEWVRLRGLVTHLGDGLHGTPNYSASGDYFFVNGNNLGAGVITIKPETKRVDDSEFEKHKKPLDGNSVLLSINGTLGRVAFYENEKIVLGKSACYFNVTLGLKKFYAKLLLENPGFTSYAESSATGSTIKNLGLKAIADWPIALPPVAEQSRIVTRVNELRSLCADLRQRLISGQATQARLADALVAF
jgi:type I restriction enzyme S subunit